METQLRHTRGDSSSSMTVEPSSQSSGVGVSHPRRITPNLTAATVLAPIRAKVAPLNDWRFTRRGLDRGNFYNDDKFLVNDGIQPNHTWKKSKRANPHHAQRRSVLVNDGTKPRLSPGSNEENAAMPPDIDSARWLKTHQKPKRFTNNLLPPLM